MRTNLSVVAFVCALGPACVDAPGDPLDELHPRVAPLTLQCDYDPSNPRERVDICHDTSGAVGGAPTSAGPYRLIQTNERGCTSGHAKHPFDFTLPPARCAAVAPPDPAHPCACVPDGAAIEEGAHPCCPGLTWVRTSGTSGVCRAGPCACATQAQLECPPDVHGLCADLDPTDAAAMNAAFGTARSDACFPTILESVESSLDGCGTGTVVRTFRAARADGTPSASTCRQTISLSEGRDYTIGFPADVRLDLGGASTDPGEAVVRGGDVCDALGVSFEDQSFSALPDACRVIERTWTVIDACELDPGALPIAVGRDEDGDGQLGDEPVWVHAGPNGQATLTASEAPASALWRTVSGPSAGGWRYVQRITLVDEVAPFVALSSGVCIQDNTCRANVVVRAEVREEGTPSEVSVRGDLLGQALRVTGSYPSFVLKSEGTHPPGRYQVEVRATDGCANESAAQDIVEVRDCKKPTPYCKNGLAVELMMTMRVQISASDLDAGSFDNCTASPSLAVRRSGTDDAPTASLTFTCEDQGVQPVQLWVTDDAGEADYCETFVVVQANMGQCD